MFLQRVKSAHQAAHQIHAVLMMKKSLNIWEAKNKWVQNHNKLG